jgi:hypothetical protein
MLTLNSGRTLLKQLVMIMFLPVSLSAQVQERMVDKSSWRNEPVKVVKLKTKVKVVKLGEKFPEGDDWLYGLAVRVQNVSDKPIARIEFELIAEPRLRMYLRAARIQRQSLTVEQRAEEAFHNALQEE